MHPLRKVIIYNLFPLLAGPFPAWRRHFQRVAEMGFNWLFVNPIQQPGKSGSLYSVKDYFGFNPALVDPRDSRPPQEQVKEAVRAARESGLSVMTDLVVNHCAVDSALLAQHPEWFLWERQGVPAHPFCQENGRKTVWKDLAKFDHRNTRDPEGLHRYVRRVVKHLLDLGFTGFRCDAAYQVPTGFWGRLIHEVKSKHPEVIFAAETLGCPTEQTRKTAAAGFDFTFNSSKWWDYRGHWLLEQYNLTRDIAPSIGFPESHDTRRLAEELSGNLAGLRQRYLFSAFFSTGLMMPMGYEFGFRRPLHVVQSRPEDWEETGVDLRDFIRQVNLLKTGHEVFQEEAPLEVLQNGHAGVIVMWKGSIRTPQEALLILNKDIHQQQHFSAQRLQDYVQAGRPLLDISPESPLDFIPEPFSYDLRPGQGLVFLAARDPAPDE